MNYGSTIANLNFFMLKSKQLRIIILSIDGPVYSFYETSSGFNETVSFWWRKDSMRLLWTDRRSIYTQWKSVNSTSDNSKTCSTQTRFHGPCLGNDNLLGISRTFSHNSNWQLRLVPSNYLLCGWMCSPFCVTSLISLFSYYIRKSRKV